MEERLLSYLKGVGAALFYGTCSVLMAFLNKILMYTYSFHFPMCIMVVQMTLTVLLLTALRATNCVSLPRYTLREGRLFLLPAVFYAANSVLALLSLDHVNIAMYGVIKRCVPLVTLTLSVVVMRKARPSPLTLFSVLLLTVGCIVAGYGDLKFDLVGYICGGVSNVTQALYLLLVQRHSAEHSNSNTLHTLLLNSVNSLPLLSLALLASGEGSEVASFVSSGGPAGLSPSSGPEMARALAQPAAAAHHHLLGFGTSSSAPPLPTAAPHRWSFLLALGAVLTCGILLNYSLFLCTNHTSALTTSVVGGMKALAQTAIGIFTFGGVSPNFPTRLGIAMNLCGTLLYISAKYHEQSRAGLLGYMKRVASLASAQDFRNFFSSSSSSSPRSSVVNTAVKTVKTVKRDCSHNSNGNNSTVTVNDDFDGRDVDGRSSDDGDGRNVDGRSSDDGDGRNVDGRSSDDGDGRNVDGRSSDGSDGERKFLVEMTPSSQQQQSAVTMSMSLSSSSSSASLTGMTTTAESDR